jgi:hypothetical protein
MKGRKNKNKFLKMKNSSNAPNNNTPITPAAFYPNAKDQKSKILRDNKGKAGIYR